MTLKQALWARELDAESQAYVLYKDIRTPGQYEDFYRRAQEDPEIFFTKGEVLSVEETADHNLLVDVENTLIDKTHPGRGGPGRAGHRHGAGRGRRRGRSASFRDAKAVVEKGEAGAQLEAAKKTVEELKQHEGTDILHLGYRQGPDLPVLQVPVPRLALHLLPLRDAADGHLRGRLRACAERLRGLPGGCGRRRAEGHPVRGAGLPRRRRASRAGKISPTRNSTCSAARSASAAPRSARSAP